MNTISRQVVRRELFKAAFDRVSGHKAVLVGRKQILTATDPRPRRERREAARAAAKEAYRTA